MKVIHDGFISGGIQQFRLELGDLTPGVYFVKITTSSGSNKTKKIIKF